MYDIIPSPGRCLDLTSLAAAGDAKMASVVHVQPGLVRGHTIQKSYFLVGHTNVIIFGKLEVKVIHFATFLFNHFLTGFVRGQIK